MIDEIFESRRSISKALSQARDANFDAQVLLRQSQRKQKTNSVEDDNALDEVVTDRSALKWCQHFHRQRQMNIELKEKVNNLMEENVLVKSSNEQKDIYLKSILNKFREHLVESSGSRSAEMVSKGYSRQDTDFASIAIQTIEQNSSDSSSVRLYEAENNDVLGQAITDLDKQRALNANLQKVLREKELTLISKDQLINQVKRKMNFYTSKEGTTDTYSGVESSFGAPDLQYVEHLKTKIEESNRTIFRYQMFLEKAHKEQQQETGEYKIEIGLVIRERDAALKKVKELQLCLDSIPSRDGDYAHQHSMFVDQIQSMSETIRLLEKQMSLCRIEKSEIEAKLMEVDRISVHQKECNRIEKEKQEISCQHKSQVFHEENIQLQKESNRLTQELARSQAQCDALRQQGAENPSPVLMALVEKMREKLIEQGKKISLMNSEM